jgi:GNAT superfamily N-acetyltransferase/nitroimidazol reductase NimA-like FMN-containing flavoprotein (pyridoxamine 5'-phosphate oxidase superfamily)
MTIRQAVYRGEHADALDVLAHVEGAHVAGVDEEGRPLVRTLHHALLDGPAGGGPTLYFHGAPRGEKNTLVGREVVLHAEEVVARLPSWVLDPERACPATTYFRSAEVRGPLEPVEDLDERAAALEALMRRLQPSGGWVPITATDRRYAAMVKNLTIVRLSARGAIAKLKLAQNRGPDELRAVLGYLWAAGETRALDRIAEANRARAIEPPPALAAPPGLRLRAALGLHARDAEAVVALLADAPWCVGLDADAIRRAHLGSAAWIGFEDPSGALVASARALSDGARVGWIYDVVVAPAYRGRGLGTALFARLLDHAALRDTRTLLLHTRTAERLYARFGFVTEGLENGSARMRRTRPLAPTTEVSALRSRAALTSR